MAMSAVWTHRFRSGLTILGIVIVALLVFGPERLPQVIRREAELFDGNPAVNWIVSGRITEVAKRYESVLAYQA